jgi:S-formylglutathione hydrolase FrmB
LQQDTPGEFGIMRKRNHVMTPAVNRRRFRVAIVACIALAACRADATADSPRTKQIAERIEQVTFASQAFDEDKHYCVVLPAEFRPDHGGAPVLYMLHGRGRSDRSLIDDTSTREALLAAPFVTVLPNGEDGWYMDSPVLPKNAYAELLDETIRDAEHHYGLTRRPEKRAIAGLSMGGYGCVRFAEEHPESFAAVVPIMGLLDFPRRGLPGSQSYEVPTKAFGTSEADWNRFNPIHSADKLRGADVLLITATRAFDRTMNENFRNRLRKLDIPHEWKVLDGAHHFDVVREAMPILVKHVSKRFEQVTTAK